MSGKIASDRLTRAKASEVGSFWLDRSEDVGVGGKPYHQLPDLSRIAAGVPPQCQDLIFRAAGSAYRR